MPSDIGVGGPELGDFGLGFLDPAFTEVAQSGLVGGLDVLDGVALAHPHDLNMTGDLALQMLDPLLDQVSIDFGIDFGSHRIHQIGG